MSGVASHRIPVEAGDGHAYVLEARIPAHARRSLLWLPALGVAARHYLPFAEALARRGVAVFLHEWRGGGGSNLRADAGHDWGYRELLERDVPASEAAISATLPDATRIVGGHSLGGQVGLLRLALAPQAASEAWLVGSGSPYWRAFPLPQRLLLPLAYRLAPWLARGLGYLPGRRIGFGGNEARGLILDWAATATAGRYAAAGIATDLEAALARIDVEVRAVVLADDWMAPPSSLRFLLSKLPHAGIETVTLDGKRLGAPADHFAWMKAPEAVADALCDAD